MKIQLHNYTDANGGFRVSMAPESESETFQVQSLFDQAKKLSLPVYTFGGIDGAEQGIGFIFGS